MKWRPGRSAAIRNASRSLRKRTVAQIPETSPQSRRFSQSGGHWFAGSRSAARRKRPNIKDAGGRWTVCIAFGQCDFTVDDDRAIPMARAALQVGDLSPFFGVVDAQSPLRIVDICEAVSDHWARAEIGRASCRERV